MSAINAALTEQGSPEWFAARVGLVTSTTVSKLLMAGKGSKPSAERENLRAQIIAERLTGFPCGQDFESAVMARGKEQEPFARAAYEVTVGVNVDRVGLIVHPTIDYAGASPDGLIGADGCLEIKCPMTKTHLGYLLNWEMPNGYQAQVQWTMACTGRQWCDFVSFDNRMPPHLQLFVVRIPRDPATIATLEAAVKVFNAEVEEYLRDLEALR